MRLIWTFLFLFFIQLGYGQQKPWYSQYILNDFIINPALAGIENYWDARTSYRNQWQGIQGAPVTLYATLQGPLRGDMLEVESPTTSHSHENPRGYAYWENYETAPSHWGLGFRVINDRTGPLSNFSAGTSLAYHLKLSRITALSIGFSAGVEEITLNNQNLYFGVQNPNDPSIFNHGELGRLKPDFDMGLWFYSSRYFIGVSAQQLIPQSLVFNGGTIQNSNFTRGKLIAHIFFQTGYKFLLNEDFSLLPSITLKSINPLPLAIDVNAKVQYQDFFWMGGTFRYKSGYSAMVGFSTNFNINLGYAYDFSVSPLNSVSGGTHEIVIGYIIRNSLRDRCPRNLW